MAQILDYQYLFSNILTNLFFLLLFIVYIDIRKNPRPLKAILLILPARTTGKQSSLKP